ncbi:hypothetical protein [Moraxella bovis]|uniref:hypothetical protein n=1 Tax=Moraxella bovis TaxID=476 RepID=UPI002225BE11|nr:hypothetical protein [Moraxella bovis]UZA37713.1 hypothetical protein LP101_11230 [Moraxella bovis]
MSFVKAVKGNTYPDDREGFLYALSRRESSSDLNLPDHHQTNLNPQRVHSQGHRGYIGYFQFGEAALYDAGYFTVPHPFSLAKNSPFQMAITNNDWTGTWTGKNGVRSKNDFLEGRKHQIDAMNFFIQRHCSVLRNLNINEFYGKKVNGIELTESGCCAGAHLVGAKHILDFALGIADETDGNKTPISHYIDLFAHYNLGTCCQRKIYIRVKKDGKPVSGKSVIVESDYPKGKYYKQIGKITNTYITNEEGRIPVIVRHPGAKIKISVDGISKELIQESNQVQRYEIDISNGISIKATLDRPSTPEPKPQPNKTPQEIRNASNQSQQPNDTKKDVKFNIVMVEADTQKPISNLKFRLTYKGNTKIHQTDSRGSAAGITAEVGQDIEVSMAGEDKLQPIFNFGVIANLDGMSYTVPVKVHAFEILVKDHKGRPVPNTEFMLFYRGRQIKKRSNQNGIFKTKMLVGFVYGFGLIDDNKPLIYLRCLQGVARRIININDVAYHRSQTKGATDVYIPSQTQVIRPPSAPKQQQTAPKPTGQSVPPRIQQNNTYTEKQGNPLTVVTNKSLASDTTRYHIYHDGTIKRENKNATGYAEFIYYDKNGGVHNLSKSAFVRAPNREFVRNKDGKIVGNKIVGGHTYLIDYAKHNHYRKQNLGYKWLIVSDDERYYLSGMSLAAVLGAMMSLGYAEYHGSGFSTITGDSGVSKTHINGINGDFRYLGVKNSHMSRKTHTTDNHFDWDANVRFVNTLYLFGYKQFLSRPVKVAGNKMLPHSKSYKNHHHHIHLQGFNPRVTDV